MTSYFYSSKQGSKKKYPLPVGFNDEDVIQILHDHSMLSQIFWPHSSTAVRPETDAKPNMSQFIVRSEDSSYKAAISSQKNGVTCTEELPLGFKITITYVVAGWDQFAEEQSRNSDKDEAASSSSLLEYSASLPNHQLYLVEERSMTALKPAMLLMKWKNEGIVAKTKNLLQVLEDIGGTGKDLLSALADLTSMTTLEDANTLVEKAKNK
ncbi:hypothetical protein P153DRAFT_361993 [Dothidotthia symphoricarpi CBS 119687]|uniref:Uncharacterized protein n=1 Tax=Dothidotthia symphoricarpi CBS 119687 TaxID=1392245 RepID=A0A6A5ZVV6_9PLEO|nr:uncharacterized protein P153DRAFT_361993 [Dothidotthia symphoricarpi CBS 119687]KAF2123426.1 hypothetical protein P153DRAFT_361993 [Dothidotthia symphoricarpi CBS 119687]